MRTAHETDQARVLAVAARRHPRRTNAPHLRIRSLPEFQSPEKIGQTAFAHSPGIQHQAIWREALIRHLWPAQMGYAKRGIPFIEEKSWPPCVPGVDILLSDGGSGRRARWKGEDSIPVGHP